MSESAIHVRSLVKDFRIPWQRRPLRAVDNVTFSVGVGEIYGLIGPNGSGKSTTMKVLLGLVRATRGSCSVFGRDSRHPASRHTVGFLPENPYFYKHLSGRETLRFYGRLCGLRGGVLEERTRYLLELVGLEEAAERRLAGYSKGMLQRIGLAQAIVHDPRLVVLDEPTAGVDPLGSRIIRDLVLSLKEEGKTIILCSHLLEQVQEVCDRIAMMSRGRLVLEGGVGELVAIEEQTEIHIKNASGRLLEGIRGLVAADGEAELVSMGHPRTTLERLFLEATGDKEHVGPERQEVGRSRR